MADTASIIQSLVSGVLTGGASAGTAIFAFFKDVKKRLSELESKVGTDKSDPKTGLYYTLDLMNDSIRRIRREIDSWQDDPPDWAVRAARRSSVSIEHQHEMEQRIEQRLRAFANTLKRLEEDLDRREEAMERSQPGVKTFITRAEYEEDSHRRAAEVSKIKDNLSSSNVWLRGVLTALGYIDSEPSIGVLPPPPKRKP